MKKIFCPALVCALLLTGCYRPDDINTLAYVMAIGIDEGKNGKNSYTIQLANPIVFAGDEAGLYGSENSSLVNITAEADSVYDAFCAAESRLLKKIDTSYMKLILFSETYNGGDIKKDLEYMLNSPRFNPKTYVAFSECSAQEFLDSLDSPLEINPARYYDNIFKTDFNEYAPEMRLKFAANEYGVFPVVGKNSTRKGTAVVKNGKLMYKKSAFSGRIYNIISGNLNSFDYTNGGLTVRLYRSSKNRPEIKSLAPPTVLCYLNFKGEILKNSDSLTRSEAEKIVRSSLGTALKNEMYNYYTTENCDVFGAVNLFKKKFTTYEKYNNFKKNVQPSDIKYNISVSVKIEREGMVKK